MAIDFDTLSAFVDAELDDATRQHMEAVIQVDPHLARQIDDLRMLKAVIAAMRGDWAPDETGVRKRPRTNCIA